MFSILCPCIFSHYWNFRSSHHIWGVCISTAYGVGQHIEVGNSVPCPVSCQGDKSHWYNWLFSLHRWRGFKQLSWWYSIKPQWVTQEPQYGRMAALSIFFSVFPFYFVYRFLISRLTITYCFWLEYLVNEDIIVDNSEVVLRQPATCIDVHRCNWHKETCTVICQLGY